MWELVQFHALVSCDERHESKTQKKISGDIHACG